MGSHVDQKYVMQTQCVCISQRSGEKYKESNFEAFLFLKEKTWRVQKSPAPPREGISSQGHWLVWEAPGKNPSPPVYPPPPFWH